MVEVPSDTQEGFDPLIGGVDVGGVEAIVVWIIVEISYVFIEWVVGAKEDIMRAKIEDIIGTSIDVDTAFEFLGDLNIHQAIPGRYRRAKIIDLRI